MHAHHVAPRAPPRGANCTDAKLYVRTIFQFVILSGWDLDPPTHIRFFFDFWNLFNFAKPQFEQSLGRFGPLENSRGTLPAQTISKPGRAHQSYLGKQHAEHPPTSHHERTPNNVDSYVYSPDSDETVDYFLLHCPLYDNIGTRLLSAQPTIHNTLHGSTTQLQ